ncbi:hypothetical protein [Methylobacterium sp. 10]|uniref:hypothetical protein n=1 Tax=Methylobacterium sp. 10 TaxID=1101191 RepID=UPI0012DE7895|nr:hypothetical protein [Methylobacterium sp. 10]
MSHSAFRKSQFHVVPFVGFVARPSGAGTRTLCGGPVAPGSLSGKSRGLQGS